MTSSGVPNIWKAEPAKDFRLALLRNWHRSTPEMVIDFTRYDPACA